MSKIKILLFFAGLFCYFPLFAQETILLKGIVKADSLDGSAIHIINVTRQTGTSNSASGEFEIPVALNDVLRFSSVQYKVIEIKISEDIIQKKFLEMYLEDGLNELPEVGISDISLSGNLEKDLEQMQVFNQAEVGFPYSNKPVPTLISRKFNSARSSPLILLINTLNGRIKMLKKAREYMKFDSQIDKGIEILPTEFFVVELGIPEEEIMNFVYFCAESPAYSKTVLAGNNLGLMEIYYHYAPLFLEQLDNKNQD